VHISRLCTLDYSLLIRYFSLNHTQDLDAQSMRQLNQICPPKKEYFNMFGENTLVFLLSGINVMCMLQCDTLSQAYQFISLT